MPLTIFAVNAAISPTILEALKAEAGALGLETGVMLAGLAPTQEGRNCLVWHDGIGDGEVFYLVVPPEAFSTCELARQAVRQLMKSSIKLRQAGTALLPAQLAGG